MKGLYIILENFSSTKLEKNGKYGKIFLSQKIEKGGEMSGWWEKDRKMPHPVVGCGRELREVVGVEHMADEDAISRGGVADEDVGEGADDASVLQDG